MKLSEIKQWGTARWNNMREMFSDAFNMRCTAVDSPDLTGVSDMAYMFHCCRKFHRRRTNSPIEHWDVRQVKQMNGLLWGATVFNQSLAKMDLSKVESVYYMLYDTAALDQDLQSLQAPGLGINPQANTDELFGSGKSLAQYNERQAERYAAAELQQELMGVLTPIAR